MGPIDEAGLRIVPANEASWEDIQAVFGPTEAGDCLCQRFKIAGWISTCRDGALTAP
jgi:hypothetical protein